MTGDSENDLRSAGDQPARPNPVDAGETPLRPFKSWASVYETEPSVWTRVRGRIAGLFSRPQLSGDAAGHGARARPSETHQSSGDVAIAPLDDFKFPWTPAGLQTPAPSAETFSSVDDALPTADDLVFVHQPALEPPKRGLFARLFTKRLKDATVGERSAEIHEDRIDAAAKALDDVGAAHFESFDRKPSASAPAFASVDDALPADALASLPLIEEIERTVEKTDEFAIVILDNLEPAKKPDVDTLEVEGQSILATALRLFGLRKAEVEHEGATENEAARTSAIFLLAKFRAFYNEIIRFQHQRAEFSAGFATAVMTADGGDAGPDAVAEGLSKRLSELLELQAAEAKWMGGEAAQYYPDAQYAMAALADEIFAYAEWEGQAAWPKHSLEQKLHRTRAAELELFKRIDRLLKDSPESVVARDLARVYLLVLAAGFQGKWRPFNLTRPIAEYRRRLFEYIHRADALMIYAPERKVFPDAASRTLEGHAVARYSAAQRWAAILVFLVVSYTVVAHIAWSRASSDLKDITTRIKSGSTVGAP